MHAIKVLSCMVVGMRSVGPSTLVGGPGMAVEWYVTRYKVRCDRMCRDNNNPPPVDPLPHPRLFSATAHPRHSF